jgi:hypothetical protein
MSISVHVRVLYTGGAKKSEDPVSSITSLKELAKDGEKLGMGGCYHVTRRRFTKASAQRFPMFFKLALYSAFFGILRRSLHHLLCSLGLFMVRYTSVVLFLASFWF